MTSEEFSASLPGGSAEGAPLDRLDGWKAIANHLGRDIRTVQRWERSEKLPVHRHEHLKQASAYAYRSELDRWLREQSAAEKDQTPPPMGSPRFPLARWSVVAGVSVLGTALLLALLARNAGVSVRDTADPLAYQGLAQGQALYGARRYNEAVEALGRAVSRDPNYGAAWALLAKTYARLAQPAWGGGPAMAARATEAARRAASVAPEMADVRLALALAARARGDVPIWRGEAQRAVKLDPRLAEAYAVLGDSYSSIVYACGRDIDVERADQYYRTALQLKPDLTTAVSNRATNLRRIGRYSECIDLVDSALRSLSDEPPLVLVRGGCRLMQGDLAGAARDLEPLRQNPKVSPAGSLVLLGLLALKRGDLEAGERDLEEAARLHRTPQSELFVAEAYAAAADPAHLMLHLKRAFDMDASCIRFVNSSPAFRIMRDTPPVRRLLDQYAPSRR